MAGGRSPKRREYGSVAGSGVGVLAGSGVRKEGWCEAAYAAGLAGLPGAVGGALGAIELVPVVDRKVAIRI